VKILYILKQESDETVKAFMEIHKREHEVSVINLKENKNYSQLVELIEKSDRIISW
jgi:hypothetical protein